MIQCPKCNRKQPQTVIICDCGYDLKKYRDEQEEIRKKQKFAARPYRWLPIFRGILRLAGGFTLITGTISTYVFISNGESYGLMLTNLTITIIACIALFAYAEVISVLLDLNVQNKDILSKLEHIKSSTNISTQSE
ncbi:MAG TPA: hypothetical protein G4N98_02435 [Thermoflexia bacterium]|nr:hypothetical protein [Thermoflexia bacterium]